MGMSLQNADICRSLAESPSKKRKEVREHISCFPTVESHYCRHESSTKYLPQQLTKAEMYRLYKTDCQNTGKTPVKEWMYCGVFKKDFNLGFHRPKKDQCDFCQKFLAAESDQKRQQERTNGTASKNKNLARQIKESHKARAQADSHINVSCYDLQQVLTTPQTLSSQLFYRRKLSTYNLTVFDIGKTRGFCYMWHEGVGKRGATNVASSSCV